MIRHQNSKQNHSRDGVFICHTHVELAATLMYDFKSKYLEN